MQREQIGSSIKKRRIQLIGKPDDYKGWSLLVYDADTGEKIEHVYRIEIILDARELNLARVFTYKVNEEGRHYIDEKTHDIARDMYVSHRPEFDLYAYEKENDDGRET